MGIPLNPCDDPPAGVGGSQTAAERPGRRAAQPGPAHAGRPDRARRQHPPGRPRHRRGAARQPAGRQRRPGCSPDRAYGLRNPFRFADPARHERDLARRRGLEHYRGDQPRHRPDRRHRRQLRLALLRGPIRQGGYDAANLTICETLYGSGVGAARRSSPTSTPPRWFRGDLPHRHVVGVRHGVHAAGQHAAGRVRRRAVLRRLRAQVHLGHGARPRQPAEPVQRSGASAAGAAMPGGHPVRSRQRPLLRRRLGRHDQAHPLHRGQPGPARRWPARIAHERRRAADGQLRRARLERPGPRRLALVRLGPGR